jgi:hypothetical protein
MEYANALNTEVSVDNMDVNLEAPSGQKINLCTDHLSHLKHIIREACRCALLKQLNERADVDEESEEGNNKKKSRKDMRGITPYVDLRATLAILSHKEKERYMEQEGKTVHDLTLDEGQQYGDSHLCRPCKLDNTSRRRLQTIVAGSIRPPHRLVHTGRIPDNKCKHPACQGVKSDTLHVMWKCPKHDHIRRPFLDCMERKLTTIAKTSASRVKVLRELIKSNVSSCAGYAQLITTN